MVAHLHRNAAGPECGKAREVPLLRVSRHLIIFGVFWDGFKRLLGSIARVMINLAQQQTGLCLMDNQPDIPTATNGPEALDLRLVELLETQSRVGRIELAKSHFE